MQSIVSRTQNFAKYRPIADVLRETIIINTHARVLTKKNNALTSDPGQLVRNNTEYPVRARCQSPTREHESCIPRNTACGLQ